MAKRGRRGSPDPVRDGAVAAIGIALAVVSFALHASALSYAFVNWDDWQYVLYNPMLADLGTGFLHWAFTAFFMGNWHPLTLISYGMDHAIWGSDATGYHLTNLLLHAANCALVTWLAWRLFARTAGASAGSAFGAALVGAIFACHPLHVESVVWISERKDVLYGLFWLLSLIAWLAYVDAGEDASRRRIAYASSLGAFALSAMSKPMAVTLPLALLILDVYPLRRLGRRADVLRIGLLEKLPFFAISLGVGVATLLAQGSGGALGRTEMAPMERFWVAEKALAFYLAKFVAPIELVPLYALDEEFSPLEWPYWTALIALVALSTAAVLSRRRAPVIATGLAFYLVTLLPVLGLVQFGHQSAADRYTYLPLLGPAFIVASGAVLAWNAGRPWRQLAAAAALLCCLLLGWRTTIQVPVWQDSVSLWRHVVDAYPGSAIAHYNLGHAHVIAGEAAMAESEWKRTLAIDEGHVPSLYELGALAGRAERYGEAEPYFAAVVRLDPSHAMARVNLAMLLDERGDRAGAVEHYRVFLRLAGSSGGGYVEHAQKRLAEAGVKELR